MGSGLIGVNGHIVVVRVISLGLDHVKNHWSLQNIEKNIIAREFKKKREVAPLRNVEVL